jgi:hypothetical protein
MEQTNKSSIKVEYVDDDIKLSKDNLQTVSLEIESSSEKSKYTSNNVEDYKEINNIRDYQEKELNKDINQPFQTSLKNISQVPKKYKPTKFYNYDHKPLTKLVLPYLEIKNQIETLLKQLVKLHLKSSNIHINLMSLKPEDYVTKPYNLLKEKILYERKSISKMSILDWDNFKKAWTNLNNKGILSKFIIAHQNTIVDRTSMFLPWYRWFIALMEDALHAEGSCLPYWDVTENTSIHHQLTYFLLDVNIQDSIQNNSKDNEDKESLLSFKVKRNFQSKNLPNFDDVKNALENVTFDKLKVKDNTSYLFNLSCCSCREKFGNGLSIDLEKLNDRIHLAIGGNMANIIISPSDPLFYMVHAYIDCLWHIWNKKGNYDSLGDCLLPGFENTTVKNLSNIEKIATLGGSGYNYELNNNLLYLLNLQ